MNALDINNSVSMTDRKECVVCPKPRRPSYSVNDPIRTLRWQLSHQAELNDSKAGMDLMEIIFSKGANGFGIDPSQASPFFCGSPPSRVENPLIQDARFCEERVPIPAPLSIQTSSPSSTSSRQGCCVRAKFGHKPAAVRIEGFEFDCLDNRDRRNCSIPTVA